METDMKARTITYRSGHREDILFQPCGTGWKVVVENNVTTYGNGDQLMQSGEYIAPEGACWLRNKGDLIIFCDSDNVEITA